MLFEGRVKVSLQVVIEKNISLQSQQCNKLCNYSLRIQVLLAGVTRSRIISKAQDFESRFVPQKSYRVFLWLQRLPYLCDYHVNDSIKFSLH